MREDEVEVINERVEKEYRYEIFLSCSAESCYQLFMCNSPSFSVPMA